MQISNVEVYGGSNITINRMSAYVGGIVGYNLTVGSYYQMLTYNSISSKYNMINCNFGLNSGNINVVMSNGDTGGVVGRNSGRIYNCQNGNFAKIDYYQIYANNKSVGGVIGWNLGHLTNCKNYGTISYITPESDDENIKPEMGLIVGRCKSGEIEGCSAYGSLVQGTLKKETKLFGLIVVYDQLEYFGTGNDDDQAVGRYT